MNMMKIADTFIWIFYYYNEEIDYNCYFFEVSLIFFNFGILFFVVIIKIWRNCVYVIDFIYNHFLLKILSW